ncbi:MAG: tetratricopeptide repeat protein [Azospirillaceae bacterium]|nr:tetratricopeptide repeat protein [Azospirillaceae bacterium]
MPTPEMPEAPAAPPPGFAARLTEAARLHQAGDLADSERCYCDLLCDRPAAAEIAPLYAVLLHQSGRLDDARTWAQRGTVLRPHSAPHLATYGHLLLDQNRLDEAIAPLQRALSCDPNAVASYNNLAIALNHVDQDTAILVGTDDATVASWTAICRERLVQDPTDLAALVRLGPLLERQGQPDRALRVYQHTLRLRPEHSRSYSRAALLRLRAAWGPPPAPAPRDDRPAITLSSLGDNGRFGNQLIQYGFLRCFAAEHDLRAETADWIGRDLFDLDEPIVEPGPPGTRRPELTPAALSAAQQAAGTPWIRIADHDLSGLFADQVPYFARHQALLQRVLKPGHRAATLLEPALERLRAGGALVALHLRRGDAVRFPTQHPFHRHFWVAPEAWYLSWLHKLWAALPRPVLYIASDQPGIEETFAAFSPRTARDLQVDIPGAAFYPDFFMLSRADIVIGANSTFSTVAALLNERAVLFLRPDAAAGELVPYQPTQHSLLPGI